LFFLHISFNLGFLYDPCLPFPFAPFACLLIFLPDDNLEQNCTTVSKQTHNATPS
jgi:hypothetical protein